MKDSLFPALLLAQLSYTRQGKGQLSVEFTEKPWAYIPHTSTFLELPTALAEKLAKSTFETKAHSKDAVSLSKNLKQNVSKSEATQLRAVGLIGDSTSQVLHFKQPHFLEVFLHITDQCNFAGCTGCATKIDTINQLFAKPMSLEQLHRYLDQVLLVAEKHSFQKVKLKYAGGEPLTPLAAGLIKEAQQYVTTKKDQCLAAGLSFPVLDQVVLTNGKTLSRRVELLKEHNLRVNVSFWGDDKGNDQARGGTGNSFERIREGIVACDRVGVEVSLTFVLTGENKDQLSHFLRMCWDRSCPEFLGDPESSTQPRAVHIALHRAQTASEHLEAINTGIFDHYVEGLREGFAEIIEMMQEKIILPDLGRLVDYLNPDYAYPVTCGSGLNYLVAGMQGVAACHESNQSAASNTEDILTEVNKMVPNYLLEPLSATISTPASQALDLFLQLHGAGGCPHHRVFEGKRPTQASAIQQEVFAKIAKEYLSLVMMHRIAQV